MKNKEFASWLPHVEPLELDGFTQSDIDEALVGGSHAHLLFGQISAREILQDLRSHGLQEKLAERGYRDFEAEIEKVSPYEEAMRLVASHGSGQPACLIDMRAHWGSLKLPKRPGQDVRALVWDWLEFTDPFAQFPLNRPPLPGQTTPGLSMFRPLTELMLTYVRRTDAHALVAVPQYFHNAVLYWKDPSLRFRFLDPLRQGQLLAQVRDFQEVGMGAASWAFAENRVEVLGPGRESWQEHDWTPAELVLGMCDEVREYLAADDPEEALGESYRFRIRSK